MKKRFVFIVVLLLHLSFILNAAIVEREVLESKLPLISAMKNIQYENVKSIEAHYLYNEPVYYVVNLSPEGWILVSAQDVVSPILAYSHHGHFIRDNQPEAVQAWLGKYAREIFDYSQQKNLLQDKGWDTQASRVIGSTQVDAVAPILKVNFNQSSPWNKYCPSDASGRAVVGCVAVAMAQAMTVPSYPDRPVGFYSYYIAPYGNLAVNYNEESPYNWNLIISGTDGKDAAARLLYQCGVSVDMGYSASGSGTQTNKVPNALRTYFKYPSSVKSISKDSYTSDWSALIINEITHGRVVILSGYDGANPGHAFNLDGYDGQTMFHVNWGWGGANNGYYTIDNMRDGSNDYTKGQAVIVGIRAPTVAPADINISNLTIEENKPAGSIVGQISIDSEATNPVYSYELRGAYSIFIHDYMPAAFYVEDGYLKTLYPFELEWEQVPVTIKVTNQNNGLSYEKEFAIRVIGAGTNLSLTAINTSEIIYYDGKLELKGDLSSLEFTIFSLSGSVVQTGQLQNGMNLVDFTSMTSGYYLLKPKDTRVKPIKLLIN